MPELSERAQSIYRYICERIDSGIPPSIREICASLNIKSTSTAHKYVKELQEKGYIQIQDNLNRSITLTHDQTVKVPLLGTVTAGQPILAVEDIEDYIPFRPKFSGEREYFALHVRGESMINAGILDGDIIICYRKPTAQNGEIVVALIDDEATVKRFYKENGHFRLQPENDSMEPIIVSEVSILGKVAAVIRSYE